MRSSYSTPVPDESMSIIRGITTLGHLIRVDEGKTLSNLFPMIRTPDSRDGLTAFKARLLISSAGKRVNALCIPLSVPIFLRQVPHQSARATK